jgi:hypothetical protein
VGVIPFAFVIPAQAGMTDKVLAAKIPFSFSVVPMAISMVDCEECVSRSPERGEGTKQSHGYGGGDCFARNDSENGAMIYAISYNIIRFGEQLSLNY